MYESKPFIKTLRSGVIETVHRASIVAVQDGRIIYSHGNAELVTPLRSAAKPFMLNPLMSCVDNRQINLTDAQICIMASSHNGELVHRDCVSSIIDMAEASIHDLRCGTHIPFYEWQYDEFFQCADIEMRQLYHNCSGKHAGMILLCKLLDIDSKNYWQVEHPIQQDIIKEIKNYFQISSRDYFHVGIDGCGVPTYALSLLKLAIAYQNISATESVNRVYKAIINEPYMIAGKNRIDTLITQELGFVAKSGSDGIFCIGCPKEKIGIALKMESGNDDAAEAAIIEVLNQLGLLPESAKTSFEPYWHLKIYTTSGVCSGYYDTIK